MDVKRCPCAILLDFHFSVIFIKLRPNCDISDYLMHSSPGYQRFFLACDEELSAGVVSAAGRHVFGTQGTFTDIIHAILKLVPVLSQ